jgi:Group II intron, maturase-specific domain
VTLLAFVQVDAILLASNHTISEYLLFNSIVQGWINYYGRFCKSMLYPLLRRINDHLEGYQKLSSRIFADLHLIVIKFPISARRA